MNQGETSVAEPKPHHDDWLPYYPRDPEVVGREIGDRVFDDYLRSIQDTRPKKK